MAFRDIIGQTAIKEHLQNALRENKVSHAYIINGEDESGKMMMAQAFAKALFCENGIDESCGECPTCKKIERKNHPDFIYVTREKESQYKLDEIREQVVDTMSIRPYDSAHKVYIIENAEKLRPDAQNAILKTIEEPPDYGMIILLTNNASLLLETIRSRCITLNLQPVIRETDQAVALLMREYQIPSYEAEELVRTSGGNIGRAIAAATDEDYRNLTEDVINLVGRAHEFSQMAIREEARIMAERISQNGADAKTYPDLMTLWYRDVLLYKSTGETGQLFFRSHIKEIKRQAQRADYSVLLRVFDDIDKARLEMDRNLDREYVFVMLLQTIKEI